MKPPSALAWFKGPATQTVKCLGLAMGGLLLATALIGFGHTPLGRSLVPGLLGRVGCPLEADVEPARVEAFRVEQLRARVGEIDALSHPALDFELGKSTRSDVRVWLIRQGLQCEELRHGSVIQCAAATELAGLPLLALHLQFDAAERLVAVDVQRSGLCGQSAVTHIQRLEHALTERVGSATARRGQWDAQGLEQQRFARSAIEFRYRHYRVTLSAVRLDNTGIALREQYQWLPPLG